MARLGAGMSDVASAVFLSALGAAGRSLRARRVLRVLTRIISGPHARPYYWAVRLTRPANLFQPFRDTYPDRYPQIFAFVRNQLDGARNVRLLSFGCSTGEEVFSLRRYFDEGEIKGIDINPHSIAACHKRQRSNGDAGMSFVVSGSASEEPSESYDAVFCMAVLRHGDLSRDGVQRCDHRITFDAFERTVAELARCVRPGGLLIIQHSNFRFCDTAISASFDTLLSVENGQFADRERIFGKDNRLLNVGPYGEVVFRKRVSDSTPIGGSVTDRHAA